MKKIAILGSTGSIGTQTVDILPSIDAQVTALTTNKRIGLLETQARALRPKMVCAFDEAAGARPQNQARGYGYPRALRHGRPDRLRCGERGGHRGDRGGRHGGPAAHAGRDRRGQGHRAGQQETLVCAGELVMRAAREKGVKILPVDSEHSAIFQCAQAAQGNRIAKILLTASGGPFFGKTAAEMRGVTREQALRHPNWSMGAKITIDSATMMNKGLELIEAMWLYDMDPEDIEIVVHRESIVHSAVEFADGAVIAQLGTPDMRLPIQYALTWPARVPCRAPHLSLTEIAKLTFYPPDYEAFPALELARRAAREKGDRGAVLSGANEAAVGLFLDGKIGFADIAARVAHALDSIPYQRELTLDGVLAADAEARRLARA